MRWSTWWQILFALQAHSIVLSFTPTVCEDEACRCDSFTRVICNCTGEYNEVTLRPDGAYRVPISTTGIIIDGCARVQFLPDTVRNLISLRNVEIRNVGYATINERGLAWRPTVNFDRDNSPGIRILIHNTTVNEISSYAIQGGVNSIQISNSRLITVRPYAFSSLFGVTNIELTNNECENIEIQAFKKFTTTNFLLRGGTIRTLPSRFLSDVEVTNLFRMEGVTVRYVDSVTFRVSGPQRVIIENNMFGVLEGDGFHMVVRGPVAFRNNTVATLAKGAFYGFSAHPDVTSVKGAQELLIDNSTITDLNPSSLMYDSASLTMRIDGLNLNMTCTCELAEQWLEVLKEQDGIINCWYSLEGYFISLSTFKNNRCGRFKHWTFWIFIALGLLMIFIAAAVIVFCVLRRERKKKSKVQIVMPDGKTYRETEFHIVVERAELLTTDL